MVAPTFNMIRHSEDYNLPGFKEVDGQVARLSEDNDRSFERSTSGALLTYGFGLFAYLATAVVSLAATKPCPPKIWKDWRAVVTCDSGYRSEDISLNVNNDPVEVESELEDCVVSMRPYSDKTFFDRVDECALEADMLAESATIAGIGSIDLGGQMDSKGKVTVSQLTSSIEDKLDEIPADVANRQNSNFMKVLDAIRDKVYQYATTIELVYALAVESLPGKKSNGSPGESLPPGEKIPAGGMPSSGVPSEKGKTKKVREYLGRMLPGGKGSGRGGKPELKQSVTPALKIRIPYVPPTKDLVPTPDLPAPEPGITPDLKIPEYDLEFPPNIPGGPPIVSRRGPPKINLVNGFAMAGAKVGKGNITPRAKPDPEVDSYGATGIVYVASPKGHVLLDFSHSTLDPTEGEFNENMDKGSESSFRGQFGFTPPGGRVSVETGLEVVVEGYSNDIAVLGSESAVPVSNSNGFGLGAGFTYSKNGTAVSGSYTFTKGTIGLDDADSLDTKGTSATLTASFRGEKRIKPFVKANIRNSEGDGETTAIDNRNDMMLNDESTKTFGAGLSFDFGKSGGPNFYIGVERLEMEANFSIVDSSGNLTDSNFDPGDRTSGVIGVSYSF